MIKVVIIDDEKPARDNLKEIIRVNFRNVAIIGEAESVETGIALLTNIHPDVLFLDINLSDGSGFTILEMMPDISFHVIFITAYDEYAVKSFQFNALDYILKPIDIHLLEKGIEKVKNASQHQYITKKELAVVLDDYSKNDEEKRLSLRESNKISFVNIKEIVRCEADSNYTVFHFIDKTQKVTSKTLKTYEELLPKSMFYRVNKSEIINLNYVKEYDKGGYILLQDGTSINVSRRKREDFINNLK